MSSDEKFPETLQAGVAGQKTDGQRIREYQEQLRTLALELSLTEERERRAIAADLHDHIGQALAVMRMKLVTLQGNAVFSGMEGDLAAIRKLLEQTIAYTRTLTFEISPPILYDLGLSAALEWLGEEFERKHGLKVMMHSGEGLERLEDQVRIILFKSVRELLMNVVKHAGVKRVTVSVDQVGGTVTLVVGDDGAGFDASESGGRTGLNGGFGLFSIRERMHFLGGGLHVDSAPGRGTQVTLTIPSRSVHGKR